MNFATGTATNGKTPMRGKN